jgi:putative protein-disulfide isomerase
MLRLTYFADPMCSWCYGFDPQLSALLVREAPVDLQVVLGGLRPYNQKVMDEAMKTMLRGHWRHVHEASGQPFSEGVLARNDFVYDTEPASRAVVIVRARAPQRALEYLGSVQRAFYREGLDVTQGDVLADLALAFDFDREVFLAAWNSNEAKQATRVDFETTKQLGVTGFPMLAMDKGGQLYAITAGFVTVDQLAERIAEITAGDPAVASA